jgi:hypothetical protein
MVTSTSLSVNSPLPPLLENAVLSFNRANGWEIDSQTGVSVPANALSKIEFVAFIKPSIGALGGQKLSQFIQPGADTRGEELECYLIRPMELPPDLNYQDGGEIVRIEPQRRDKGKILQIKMDTRIPLVTTIVGRHLVLTVEWSNHGT